MEDNKKEQKVVKDSVVKNAFGCGLGCLLVTPVVLIGVPVYLISKPFVLVSKKVKEKVAEVREKKLIPARKEIGQQKFLELEEKYASSPIGTIEKTKIEDHAKFTQKTMINTKYGPIIKLEHSYKHSSAKYTEFLGTIPVTTKNYGTIPIHIESQLNHQIDYDNKHQYYYSAKVQYPWETKTKNLPLSVNNQGQKQESKLFYQIFEQFFNSEYQNFSTDNNINLEN